MNDVAIIESRIDATWEIANDLLVVIRKGCKRHGKDPDLWLVIASAVSKLIDGLEEVNPKIVDAILDHLELTRGDLFD